MGTDIPLSLLVLIGVFALVSSLLALSTMANAVRLRNVRMSWKSGRMKGYPLFSSLFLASMLFYVAIGLYEREMVNLAAAAGYLVLAGGWFITSFLASKRYITDHGIVKNVNDPSQTVAWHQVRDFVEQKEPGSTLFIFLYSESADNPEQLIRLELRVPCKKLESFKKIISHKLGRRITCYGTESIRVEQLD